VVEIKEFETENRINDETIIWRFMDFFKFTSLILNKSIHFSRTKYFDDPLEGSRTLRDERNRTKIYGKEASVNHEYYDKSIKPDLYGISCWHINEYESASMWKMYSNKDDGVAIRSTYGSLKKSFESELHHNYYFGQVCYDMNYANGRISTINDLETYFFKYKSYSFENELRAIIYPTVHDSELIEKSDFGWLVPVCLATLINSIYINPNSKKSYIKQVKTFLKRVKQENLIELIKNPSENLKRLY